MEEGVLLNANEVALLVDCSIQTLGYWYRFKKENPTNEYSMMLPDYIQYGNRKTRYWKDCDIDKLIEFKNAIPKGRNGILGSVTQKYLRK